MIRIRSMPAATTSASFVKMYKNGSPQSKNATPSTAAITNE